MSVNVQMIAAQLVEAHKNVAPYENALNTCVQEFSHTIQQFYRTHNIYGAGTYAWAANLGFDHITAHDVTDDGVWVTVSRTGDSTTKFVTFAEMVNVTALLDEDFVKITHRRKVENEAYKAARQVELEAELANLSN